MTDSRPDARSMETRKVQTVGGGTYTVSLPKEWARAVGISAGSVVNVHSHIDDLLVVQPSEAGPEESVTTVTLPENSPESVERTLRAAYAAGHRVIRLESPSPMTDAQRRAARRVTRNLTGVTVVETGERWLRVQAMLDAEEVSIRQSVRQLQFVALSMHRAATAALSADRPDNSVGERDAQADRLYALVERYFWRGLARLDEIDRLGETRPALFTLWTTARELERVADHAESIAEIAADGAVASDGELSALAERARAVVEDAVSATVGDADVATARASLRARDALREDLQAAERALFEADDSDYRLTRVLDSLGRTAEHGATIAETALMRSLDDQDRTDGTQAARSENV